MKALQFTIDKGLLTELDVGPGHNLALSANGEVCGPHSGPYDPAPVGSAVRTRDLPSGRVAGAYDQGRSRACWTRAGRPYTAPQTSRRLPVLPARTCSRVCSGYLWVWPLAAWATVSTLSSELWPLRSPFST